MSERQLVVHGTRYRLVRVGPAEMKPLVPFFRKAFRRSDFTLDWLRGKYGCTFDGIEGFSCVAFTDSGEAVASFGMLPWPIRWGTRTEIAAQAVDAATHHAHRRRGLFSQLAGMARELCDSAGVSFLFAFPHPAGDSYPGFIRSLGYIHLDDLVEYRHAIRTLWVERFARRVGGPVDRLYQRQLERAMNAHVPANTVFDNSLLSEGFAATSRRAEFHAYKSFAGSRVLATDGGRVWLKVRRGLLIGDLEASAQDDMDKTIWMLERFAVRLGIQQIVFQSSTETRFTSYFGNRYRALPCLTVVYQNLRSQIPPEKLRFTFGDLDNF